MKKLFILFIFLLFLTIIAFADIINVPEDYPTIQEGINVAVDGDTVLVQTGTYFENIDFNGKNITVGSLFLTTQDTTYISNTIIDGSQNGSVVTFDNSEDPTAVLCGLTIQNGNGFLGSINCYQSDPTLMFLHISNNFSSGIRLVSSDSHLFSLKIYNNIATYAGGGLYCHWSCHVLLDNVLIFDNSAGFGGGIYCNAGAEPIIINSVLYSNTATTPLLAQAGGGILSTVDSNPILINSIMYDNFPQQIALFSEEGIFPTYVTISYSNIMGGESGILVNSYMCEIYWLYGNIDSDPLFVNPDEGDFHLSDNSPCIGAGIDEIEINGTWYYAPLFDIEGNPRPDPVGSMPDMGAYENPLGEPQVGITQNQLPSTDYQLTNYPNPFNPETTISFNLTVEDVENTELIIYNIKGQKVKTLINEQLEAGKHFVNWNGKDNSGKQVSTGIYFYKLKSGKYQEIKKMVLLE